jgi:hypothetical protein
VIVLALAYHLMETPSLSNNFASPPGDDHSPFGRFSTFTTTRGRMA